MRLLLAGLLSFCFGLWFFYDGLIGYPNQQIRAEEFKKFTEENSKMDELDRLNKWNELAVEKGWPTGNPGERYKDFDINEQYVYGTVFTLIGLGLLSPFVFILGQWGIHRITAIGNS